MPHEASICIYEYTISESAFLFENEVFVSEDLYFLGGFLCFCLFRSRDMYLVTRICPQLEGEHERGSDTHSSVRKGAY